MSESDKPPSKTTPAAPGFYVRDNESSLMLKEGSVACWALGLGVAAVHVVTRDGMNTILATGIPSDQLCFLDVHRRRTWLREIVQDTGKHQIAPHRNCPDSQAAHQAYLRERYSEKARAMGISRTPEPPHTRGKKGGHGFEF